MPLFASLRFKGGGALSVDLALSAEKNGIGGCLVGLRLMQECFPHSPVCIAPFGKEGRKGGQNLQYAKAGGCFAWRRLSEQPSRGPLLAAGRRCRENGLGRKCNKKAMSP